MSCCDLDTHDLQVSPLMCTYIRMPCCLAWYTRTALFMNTLFSYYASWTSDQVIHNLRGLNWFTVSIMVYFPHGLVSHWDRTSDPWAHSSTLASPQILSKGRHGHWERRSCWAAIMTWKRQWALAGQAGFRSRQHDQRGLSGGKRIVL